MMINYADNVPHVPPREWLYSHPAGEVFISQDGTQYKRCAGRENKVHPIAPFSRWQLLNAGMCTRTRVGARHGRASGDVHPRSGLRRAFGAVRWSQVSRAEALYLRNGKGPALIAVSRRARARSEAHSALSSRHRRKRLSSAWGAGSSPQSRA